MIKDSISSETTTIDFDQFKKEVLNDYQLACLSRETSLLGRKEVLSGKAKFGIFGDGKELAQIALAKQFKNGDFRSGYYRDQTLMFAIEQLTITQYFSGLYAHTDLNIEPMSAGRQMGGHFATHSLDENGDWKNLMLQKNSSADISPTAGQMPRLLGLGLASKIYRNHPELKNIEKFTKFSSKGNEVAFGTIGDASTSEGPFWETLNAAGVLQVPLVMSVWDDGFGISVPREKQTIKDSISEALSGFQRDKEKDGFEIFTTKGWDYPHLVQTYEKATLIAREQHIPVLVHVKEVNQPQGHSTSGSHERYKSNERLAWESEFDCIQKFKEWILNYQIEGTFLANIDELETIEKNAKNEVREAKNKAWKLFVDENKNFANELIQLLETNQLINSLSSDLSSEITELKSNKEPIKKEVFSLARRIFQVNQKNPTFLPLNTWIRKQKDIHFGKYNSHLYSQSNYSSLKVPETKPEFNENSKMEDGRIILRENFKKIFENHPEALIFGEDAGQIGGVNQSLEGLQEIFGELRVSDTGIRECTIVGQGIGLAMRGLRPIAEIQYLDYLLYAIQILSDDLSTLQYRTKGRQKAPLIISTRGHRLEGVWHSGSPMGMIVNALRGIYICVPRNMTKAAGFYNTLMYSDDPALVIEPLNGYRIKEQMPNNIGEFTTPLGIPEIVKEGEDLTLVSYGSTFNLCEIACKQLEKMGINVELIDVQTLIPFDINHSIKKSLSKTNRLLIVDEDVSSGATAYILDKILVEQQSYFQLDSMPYTLSAKDHRPAYGSDGDYFSKPNIEDIIEKVIDIIKEADVNFLS
ncbi:MAG: transketolase [Flavobacteriia bacterium]|nr:transketolase [Flavobacteriia bacterium]